MSELTMQTKESMMTPGEIVHELDRYIVGQKEAKRKVAIALRNRWRRMLLPQELRDEVMPKNILMIGPTGVGKTEIARRLAKLAGAPFVKVEATKFTEVGYVGRDVETIIRDLVEIAYKMQREQAMTSMEQRAESAAEDRVLAAILPPPKSFFGSQTEEPEKDLAARQDLRKQLRRGELDDKDIEIDIESAPIGMEIMAPPGMEEMTNQLSGMLQSLSTGRKKKRKMKVKDALRMIRDEEAAKLVDNEEIKSSAINSVEQNGIVFIDEIDKVTRHGERSSGDVSREGVQRDLLPLLEGCTVTTKYGSVHTDHILFIASGAFHMSKPSDLIPELQGRLPIRVELKSLTTDDFERILKEPKASLTEQYVALLNTENVTLDFVDDGTRCLAEIAWQLNERQENIGARRLHTVIERLLEEVLFDAPNMAGKTVVVDKAYVEGVLKEVVGDTDLAKYIL